MSQCEPNGACVRGGEERCCLLSMISVDTTFSHTGWKEKNQSVKLLHVVSVVKLYLGWILVKLCLLFASISVVLDEKESICETFACLIHCMEFFG
jgi:hypothetical protein